MEDVCHGLTGRKLDVCKRQVAYRKDADECAGAFIRAGCDKTSRFVLAFIVNLNFNVFFVLIFIQFYLNPLSVYYVPGYTAFAVLSILYFVLDTLLFLVILGSSRFKYLNLIGVVMQYGGRTVCGILMTIFAAFTMPPDLLVPLVVLFFLDIWNATLAGGSITASQARPFMRFLNAIRKPGEFDADAHCVIKEKTEAVGDVYVFHGINSSVSQISGVIKYLAKNTPFNVIACDARGHGLRSGIGNKTEWDKTANDIVSLINDRSTTKNFIHKPVLYGQSMGGAVALSLAQKYPDRFSKVIAVGAPNGQMVFKNPKLPKSYTKFMTPSTTSMLPGETPSKTNADVFLVHTIKDNFVPIDEMHRNASQFDVPEDRQLSFTYKLPWFGHQRSACDDRTKTFVIKALNEERTQ